MIKRLFFKNFRAFESLDIPLTKINLFFGPNNSGKSSIISALTLLSQTHQSADPEVRLLFDGKYEKLGTYKDVVFRNITKKNIQIGIECNHEGLKENYQNDYLKGDLARTTLDFHYRPQRHQTVIEGIKIEWPPGKTILTTKITQVSENQIISYVDPIFKDIPIGKTSSGLIHLSRFAPDLHLPMTKRGTLRRSLFVKFKELAFALYLFQNLLSDNLNNVEFIGPFRKGPERIYPFSGEAPSSVGADGGKAIDILAADHSRRKGKKRDLLEKVSKWFETAHIARNISILPVTDRHYTVRLENYETHERENLADSGYGCSQILPILVAGNSLPEGSKLIIEQPELHLHPTAEAEIGTFFYQIAMQRNLQLFVETHSEHLLLRLQYHVAHKDLSPDDINVFYVYADQGQKHYKRVKLADDGFFTEDWPKGFFPERLNETKRILTKADI